MFWVHEIHQLLLLLLLLDIKHKQLEYSPVVKVKVRQPSFKVNGKLTLGTSVPENKFGHCDRGIQRERE